MTITLREIAQLLEGRLHGDGSLAISGAAIIRDAQHGDITLADNAKFAPQLAASGASAAIVSANFTPQGLPYIEVSDVHRSFAKILAHLRPQRINAIRGIDAQARVDISAHLAESAYVGPAANIGPRVMVGENVIVGARTVIHGGVQIMPGCQIGDDCEVFPNVVLYENTILGPRVVIHSGSVIGAYGFGYECVEGRHRRSAQLGNVEIEADVEIGAGTTIDRGTYGATRIGEGTKIDNQVMIAHNCRIGRHNLICSQVGIAGSASTGDFVVMAGKAGLRDHIHVGDRVVICAQSGVMSDAPAGVSLAGSPAISEREQMQMWAACYRLPEMRKQFKALQRMVEQLVQNQSTESLPLRESA